MDANGQLTFTRASDATRVGPNGYIEKVRTNLLPYSQEFDNGYWLKQVGGLASAPVVTANAEIAPDGTMTAERIVFNLNGGTLSADLSQIAGATITLTAQENTGSVYLKTTDGTSKVFTMVNPDGSVKTITVTGTYQRFTNTSSAASAGGFRLRLRGGEGTADSASIAAWGAQFESGVATDYIPTTTAAVSVGPVSGTPRLDYLGSDCPRLLLEPQRSNLLPMSEQMNNTTFWNSLAGAFTITPNVTISPDGYQNADSITLSNTTNRYFVSAVISLTPGAVYTYSVYMKSASGTLDVFMSGVNGLSGQMKSVTTEWQRFTLTFTMHANGLEYFGIDQRASGSSTSGTLYFWGAQVELGAYATSYIPTLGTSVTRVADFAAKSGISSLIGQTEGTLFAEFEINATNTDGLNRIFSVTDGTLTSRVLMIANTDETFRFVVSVAASSVVNITTSTSVLGGRHKVAFAYKASDYVAYVDGVQVGSNTAVASVPASLATAYVGTLEGGAAASGLEGTVSQALLFKTRLDNATLQSLTTL
jgi:hypothetical protein